MSLNVSLNAAMSGLFANQRAIAATSENIANLNTEDYTRREARFVSDAIPGQFAGVDVEITRAAVNRFLQGSSYGGSSERGRTGVIADALSRIENSLGAPGENLSFANELEEAFGAFALLSADPSSISARAGALAALEAAFNAFGRTQDAIDNEVDGADAQLRTQLSRVNALLEDVYNLNEIAPESDGAGDQIDARLRELAELIDINVARDDLGRVSVTTTSGLSLVTPGGFSSLALSSGTTAILSLSSVDPDTGAATVANADVTASVTGGEIGGLLFLRNTELPRLATIVDDAARGVATALNTAYAQNTAAGATTPTTTSLIVETGGRFSVNASLLATPGAMALARPTGGSAGGANDGAGAIALADVVNDASVQSVREAVTQLGAAAGAASERQTSAASFARDLEARLDGDGGVNIDEELSNLVLYQRAYNANARVIAAVDELFQSLLNIL